MKQVDLIHVHVSAPHCLQGDVSVPRAGDYEMSVSSLENRPEFTLIYLLSKRTLNFKRYSCAFIYDRGECRRDNVNFVKSSLRRNRVSASRSLGRSHAQRSLSLCVSGCIVRICSSFFVDLTRQYGGRRANANDKTRIVRTLIEKHTYLSSIHAAQEPRYNNRNHPGAEAMPAAIRNSAS